MEIWKGLIDKANFVKTKFVYNKNLKEMKKIILATLLSFTFGAITYAQTTLAKQKTAPVQKKEVTKKEVKPSTSVSAVTPAKTNAGTAKTVSAKAMTKPKKHTAAKKKQK